MLGRHTWPGNTLKRIWTMRMAELRPLSRRDSRGKPGKPVLTLFLRDNREFPTSMKSVSLESRFLTWTRVLRSKKYGLCWSKKRIIRPRDRICFASIFSASSDTMTRFVLLLPIFLPSSWHLVKPQKNGRGLTSLYSTRVKEMRLLLIHSGESRLSLICLNFSRLS